MTSANSFRNSISGLVFFCFILLNFQGASAQISTNPYSTENIRTNRSTWDYSNPYSSQGNNAYQSTWDYTNPYSSQGNNAYQSTWDYTNPYSSQGNNAYQSTWDYSNPTSSQGNNAYQSTWDYSNPTSSQGNNAYQSTWDYSNPTSSQGNNAYQSTWDYSNPTSSQGNNAYQSTWDYSNPTSSQGNSINQPILDYNNTNSSQDNVDNFYDMAISRVTGQQRIQLFQLEWEIFGYYRRMESHKYHAKQHKWNYENPGCRGCGLNDLRLYPERLAEIREKYRQSMENDLREVEFYSEKIYEIYRMINSRFGDDVEIAIRMKQQEDHCQRLLTVWNLKC